LAPKKNVDIFFAESLKLFTYVVARAVCKAEESALKSCLWRIFNQSICKFQQKKKNDDEKWKER